MRKLFRKRDKNIVEASEEKTSPKTNLVPLTPMQDKSRGGLVVGTLFLLVFALPWCGITGLFTISAIRPLWEQSQAKQSYVEGTGVVEESEVEARRDEDGTQYKPIVRYNYEVDGEAYTSDRVAFDGGWSSGDHSDADRICRKYPRDAKIKIWYDPGDPSKAVLEIESVGMSWFLLIFLQPFWTVGIGLILAVVLAVLSSRPVNRFFQTDLSALLDKSSETTLMNRGNSNDQSGLVRIPGWGILRVDPDGHHFRRRRNYRKLLFAAGMGYGLSFFLSIFILAFFQPGGAGMGNCTGGTFLWVLIYITLPSVTVAVLLHLGIRSKSSAKRIDIQQRMRQITINKTTWSYDDIQQLYWKRVLYPNGMKVNNSRFRGWSVGVMLPADWEEPLIFLSASKGKSDQQKIVARMGHYFSQLLEKELVECQGR